MRLEYLVPIDKENSILQLIENNTVNTLSVTNRKLNDDICIIMVGINADSEEMARKLSDINDKIIPFKPVVLINESAAYFNRRLFPLINNFERKLRKLLYAASALKPGDDIIMYVLFPLFAHRFFKDNFAFIFKHSKSPS